MQFALTVGRAGPSYNGPPVPEMDLPENDKRVVESPHLAHGGCLTLQHGEALAGEGMGE